MFEATKLVNDSWMYWLQPNHRMRSGHLNMKLVGTFKWNLCFSDANYWERKVFSRTNGFFFHSYWTSWKNLEAFLRCWLRHSRADIWFYMESWERQNVSTAQYSTLALDQMLYLASFWMQKMNVFRSLTKWDVLIPQDYCLFSSFCTRYLELWADFFFFFCTYIVTFIAMSVDYAKT